MPTSWPNSKKCSTAEAFASLACLIALCSSSALASPSPSSSRPPQARELRADLHSREGSSFETILQRWETRYGSKAVTPLLGIASDSKSSDPDRYVALMGAAKLGGPTSAPSITRFLRDPSWMIRSAALKALAALQNKDTAPSVLPLLRDPALVVRLEAIHAVESLRPEGSVTALADALDDPSNYHRGKAQWVPQRALEAISKLQAHELAPRLKPLLAHQDPALRAQVARTLQELGTREPAAHN